MSNCCIRKPLRKSLVIYEILSYILKKSNKDYCVTPSCDNLSLLYKNYLHLLKPCHSSSPFPRYVFPMPWVCAELQKSQQIETASKCHPSEWPRAWCSCHRVVKGIPPQPNQYMHSSSHRPILILCRPPLWSGWISCFAKQSSWSPSRQGGQQLVPFFVVGWLRTCRVYIHQCWALTGGGVDKLLKLWAATLIPHSDSPPITNYQDLHNQIDAIDLGSVSWEHASLGYIGTHSKTVRPLEWKTVEYDL